MCFYIHTLNNLLMHINPAFISDINTFNVAVIVFWIPFSIQIITRISDRYKSAVIIRAFEKNWLNRWLLKFAFGNLILGTTLRIFMIDGNLSNIEKFLSSLVWLFFMFTLLILFLLVKTIITYSYKTDIVLQGLIDDIQKIF